MPYGILPYTENKQASNNITRLGADMRVSYQGERLAGTGSLLTATSKDMDPTLQANIQSRKNNWVYPAVVLGIFFLFLGVKSK